MQMLIHKRITISRNFEEDNKQLLQLFCFLRCNSARVQIRFKKYVEDNSWIAVFVIGKGNKKQTES